MASGEEAVASSSATGNQVASDGPRLFSNIKLWFSRGVPQRDWLIQNAQLNGAEIVPLEKQADILLVDHARKNQPPGTTSYQFIERSIRKGALEALADHAVGLTTRVARPVGSVTTAPRGGRNPFTDAEDQFLWNMIQPFREKGGQWKGNEIYKQIERMNPRHTYQSWRDHYIKTTQLQNRQVTERFDLDAQPTEEERQASPVRQQPRRPSPPIGRAATAIRVVIPPKERVEVAQTTSEPQIEPEVSAGPSRRKRSRDEVDELDEVDESRTLMPPPVPRRATQRPRTPEEAPDGSQSISPIMTPLSQRTSPRGSKSPVRFTQPFPYGFTDYWAKKLFHRTAHILDTDPQKWNKGWRGIAKANAEKGYSAQEWKDLWETVILPEYCKRRGMLIQDVSGAKCLGGDVNDGDSDSEDEETGDDEGDEAEISAEEHNDSIEQDQTVEKEVLGRVGEGIADQDQDRQRAERQDHGVREENEDAEAHGQAVTTQDEADESEAPSSPGVISCSKCFTSESRKWRRDREGNLLCNDCGRFLKSSGILRPSDAQTIIGSEQERESINAEEQFSTPRSRQHRPSDRLSSTIQPPVTTPTPNRADAGVQTSPIVPSATPERRRQRSPSFEPDTPSGSRPPAANEARKRSEGTSSKSNSQGTNKSSQNPQVESMPESNTAVNFIEEEQQRRQRQVRPRSPSEPAPEASSRKKKPRLQDDPNTLAVTEISQNSEYRLQATGSFDVANAQRSFDSPSPRHLKFPTLKSTTPHSSLFVPQDSDEEADEEDLPSPMSARQQSSPMLVNLISEDDNARLHSSQYNQNQDDLLSEPDTASQYAFETAPDVSEDWETAPEEPVNPTTRDKGRIETQALWDITDQVVGDAVALEDAFALPEPEGGWETIEAGYEQQQEEAPYEEVLDVDDVEEDDDEVDDDHHNDDELPDLPDVISGKYAHRSEAQLSDDNDTPEPDASTRGVVGKGKAPAAVSPSSHSSYDTDDDDDDEQDPYLATTFADWQKAVSRSFRHDLDMDFDEMCMDATHATGAGFYSKATDVLFAMMQNYLQAHELPPLRANLIIEKKGAVIPDDIKGCWTKEDDDRTLAYSSDAKDWEMMVKKHGREAFDRRVEFLEKYRRA